MSDRMICNSEGSPYSEKIISWQKVDELRDTCNLTTVTAQRERISINILNDTRDELTESKA